MLNTKQLELYESVVKFKNPITISLSEGGVGKTYCLKHILEDYDGTFEVTALSHRACAAINTTTGFTARTIHSYLGMVMANVGYSKQLVAKGDGDISNIKSVDLLVIDEVSQLNTQLFERVMQAYNSGIIKQLLLLGDLIQLEAIGGTPDLLSLNATYIELTEQMRQSSASIQLKQYLANLRSAIETGSFFDPIDTSVPEFTYYENHKDFCINYSKCNDEKLMIAYRNTKVDKYTFNIHPEDSFNVGDVVIIDKPLGKSANQTKAVIKEVLLHDDVHYKLVLTNSHNEDHTVYHFTHKPTLEQQLDRFKTNNDVRGYHEALDKCFNLRYAYATTVTKAQGTTVDHIWIDLNDITSAYTQRKTKWNNPISLNSQLRLIYVAISRMKTKCSMFIGTTRKYSYLK